MAISKRLLGLGALAAFIFAACGGIGASAAPTGKAAYVACVAFDTGGLGDKNFNDLAFKGLETDAKAAGYTTRYAEAQGATDYAANIQRLIVQGCESIITVGFLQSQATAEAAAANPNIAFSQVDTAWNLCGPDFTCGNADDTPHPPNFTGLDYKVDEAAMLAGYLAAAWTDTGKIGTYGGLAFPGVTRFMDGLWAGVQYYNQQKGTDVEVIGWDGSLENPADSGTFVGGSGGNDTWNDPAKGEVFASTFLGEDVDIVHPVAGATGNGTIKGMFEAGKWAIGVDTDQWISLEAQPYHAAILTSAQKAIDVSVLDVIEKNYAGDLGGEDYVGTIANQGVLLAPFHDFEDEIAAIEGLQAELDALEAALGDGSITVCSFLGRGC